MKSKPPISPWRVFQTQMEAALYGDGDSAAAGQVVAGTTTPPRHPNGAMATVTPEIDTQVNSADAANSDLATPGRWRP